MGDRRARFYLWVTLTSAAVALAAITAGIVFSILGV